MEDGDPEEANPELSYDTRLPAVRWTSKFVEVVLLDGRHLYLRRAVVALHAPDAAWPQPTGAQVVKEAKRFLGLQYLWAGTSGFGFDCSGLTHSVFHELGVTIPRDAAPQALQGTKVSSRSALQPGDLIFFRSAAGAIHHVGLYIGGGIMIHSPATGRPVRLSSIYSEPYLSEFAGGRRYADGSALTGRGPTLRRAWGSRGSSLEVIAVGSPRRVRHSLQKQAMPSAVTAQRTQPPSPGAGRAAPHSVQTQGWQCVAGAGQSSEPSRTTVGLEESVRCWARASHTALLCAR